METAKRTIILLIFVLLTAVPAQSAGKPATEISNTRKASCLVKLTSDPAVLPVSYETICALLYSSGVGGKAAREILGISPDQISDVFTIDVLVETTGDIQPGSSRMGRSMPSEIDDDDEYQMMMEMYAPSIARARSSRTTGIRPRRPTIRRTTTATSLTSAAEQTFFFQLSVFQLPDDAKPAAEEFMNALVDNLRSSLNDAFNVYRKRLRGQLDLAEEEATRAEHELIRLQKSLREISGGRDLNRNRILSDSGLLRERIQKGRMDEASALATFEATTKRIAEIEAKTKEQLENDPVTKELQRILKLQLQHLENAKKFVERGRASSTELADAEEKLARTRIELAKRREEISKSAGGDQLDRLNAELANLSVQKAQHEAYSATWGRQIAEAQDLLAKADEYELFSLKVDIAKQSLEETLVWRDRMERRNRLVQPPTVTIIGAD